MRRAGWAIWLAMAGAGATLLSAPAVRAEAAFASGNATGSKVRVVTAGGPWIEVNGRRLPPLMLFVNTEVRATEETVATIGKEIQLARQAGVPFITFITSLPWKVNGKYNYESLDTWLDFILSVYPEALIMPRIRLQPPNVQDWAVLHGDELITYGDGTQSVFSLASPFWVEQTEQALAALVNHIEANPRYAEHVIGYHLAYGNTDEWFHLGYREKGNDVSGANRKGFWIWLLRKYGSTEALARAWRRESISETEVTIPSTTSGYTRSMLLDVVKDRPVIDFFEYSSQIVAERILNFAHQVKSLTGGSKLVAVFYGYLFELPDSNSGHLALDRILTSSDIDLIASPFSYYDRRCTGGGPFMGPVDSALLHGKIWMQEDDTRTFLSGPDEPDAGFNLRVDTREETIAVHRRNLGAVAVHRGGLWWMDLWSKGWLADEELWANIATMRQAMERYYEGAGPFVPDVAFVVSEKSFFLTTHGESVNGVLLGKQRSAIQRSGVSYGLYLLDDVVRGQVVGPKVYVFLNAYYLTPEERSGIDKLKKDGNVLVWVYAGDVAGQDADPEQTTGFQIKVLPGGRYRGTIAMETELHGAWREVAGKSWGETPRVQLYSVAAGPGVTVLGKYAGSDEPAFAVLKVEDGERPWHEQSGWSSIFYGSWMLSPEIIRAIADFAGVPVYCRSNDVVQVNGDFLSIHATTAGQKTIYLPRPGRVIDMITRELLADGVTQYSFDMAAGTTRWLQLCYDDSN